MKALVTGGGGFIGSNLYRKLARLDYVSHIYSTCSSLAEVERRKKSFKFRHIQYNDIERILDVCRPDTIFHLGGNPIVKCSVEEEQKLYDENLNFTHKLLQWCNAYKPLFIFTSSATVYGQLNGYPFKETDITRPRSVYAATKLACEALIQAYGALDRIEYIIFRLVATVGKYATHGLCYDVFNKLLSDDPNLQLIGREPGSKKPYIHVDDVVHALITAAKLKIPTNEIYNLATINELYVSQVADMIQTVMNIKKTVVYNSQEAWSGDDQVVAVDGYKWIDTLQAYSAHLPKFVCSAQAINQATHDMLYERNKR